MSHHAAASAREAEWQPCKDERQRESAPQLLLLALLYRVCACVRALMWLNMSCCPCFVLNVCIQAEQIGPNQQHHSVSQTRCNYLCIVSAQFSKRQCTTLFVVKSLMRAVTNHSHGEVMTKSTMHGYWAHRQSHCPAGRRPIQSDQC